MAEVNNSANMKADSLRAYTRYVKSLIGESGSSGSGGVTDYENLTSLPSIEGITLTGNKSASDLGLVKASDVPNKTSQLSNDSGFITLDDIPEDLGGKSIADITEDTEEHTITVNYTDETQDGPFTLPQGPKGDKPNVVQISADEPTDPDVKIWIDPSEVATEDMLNAADQLRAEIQALKNAFPSLHKDDSFYVMSGNYGNSLYIDNSYYMMTKPIPAKTTSIDVTWHVEHNVPGTGRISIISDKTNTVLSSYEYSFDSTGDYTFSIPMGFGEETVLAVASDCVGYAQSSEDGVRTEVQPGGGLPMISTDGTKLLPVGSVITRGSMDGSFYFGIGVTTYVAESSQSGTLGGNFKKTGQDYRPTTSLVSSIPVGTIGRWWVDGNKLKTNADGAEFYFKTIGVGTQVDLMFENSTGVNIAYQVDNGEWTYSKGSSTGSQTKYSVSLPVNPSGEIHNVRVIIDGMAEYCGKTTGGGAALVDISHLGGAIYPILPNTKVIAFYGDSITEGTNTLGPDATKDDNSGARSYPFYCCDKLRAVSYRIAHGGSGIATDGSLFRFFKAVTNITNSVYENNAKIDAIVINHGTNDMWAEDKDLVATSYEIGLRNVSCAYPNTPIFCMIPFEQCYKDMIKTTAAKFPHTYVIETEGWLSHASGSTDFTDTLHPSQSGHQKAGAKLADAIKEILGEDFFFES